MYEIHKAAFDGDVKKVLAMLEKNEDVNAYDEEGYTPLCRAIMGSGKKEVDNHIQIIELLISFGADVNKPQKYNQSGTPIFWATEVLRRPKLRALLLQHGAISTSKEYSISDTPNRLKNAYPQETISIEKNDIPDLSKYKGEIGDVLMEFFATETFQKLRLKSEKEIIKGAKRFFAGNLALANKLFTPETDYNLWLACSFFLGRQPQGKVKRALHQIIDKLVEKDYPPAITQKMHIVEKAGGEKERLLSYYTQWIKTIIKRFEPDHTISAYRCIIECTFAYSGLDPEEQIKLLKQLLTEAVRFDDDQLNYCLAKLYLGQCDFSQFFHVHTPLQAKPIIDIEMAIKYLSMSAAQGNEGANKDYWVILSELFIQIRHQGKMSTKKVILGSADIQEAIERLPNKKDLLLSYLPKLLLTSNAEGNQKTGYPEQSLFFWNERNKSNGGKRINQSKSGIEIEEEVEKKRREDAADLEAQGIKEYYEMQLKSS